MKTAKSNGKQVLEIFDWEDGFKNGVKKQFVFNTVEPRQSARDGSFLKWVYSCDGYEIDIRPRLDKSFQRHDKRIEDPDKFPIRVQPCPFEELGRFDNLLERNSWYSAKLTDDNIVIVYPPEIRLKAKAAKSDAGAVDPAKQSRSLRAKRSKAGKEKRLVKDIDQRKQIKAGFRHFRKYGYDSNNAAAIRTVKKWKNKIPDLTPDAVRRIAGVKK
jgi:hypothetical protein